MPQVSARNATLAMLLILLGAGGVQLSSTIAVGLFNGLTPLGTSGARMLVAAVILLIVLRPQILGRTAQDWITVVTYGVAIAGMNGFLYMAIARIPLGVATTIDFLGPAVVALLTSRRAREWILAVLALLGVALIAGLGGDLDPLGVVFAAIAATFFGLYTFFAPRVGGSSGGVRDLALSVSVAAVLLSPVGVPTLVSASGSQWVSLALIALLGTALPFFVDTLAGKLSSAGMIGIFFAFDPVLGSVFGYLFLDQALTIPTIIGIALIVIAGSGIVFSASDRKPPLNGLNPEDVIR